MIRTLATIITAVLTVVFAAAFIGETVLLFLEFGLDLGLTMATFASQQFIFFPTLGLVALFYFRPAGQVALETAFSKFLPALGGLIILAVTVVGTYYMVNLFRGDASERSWWEVSRAALEADHETALDAARVQAVEDARAAWRADTNPQNRARLDTATEALQEVRALVIKIEAAEAAEDADALRALLAEKARADGEVPRVKSVIAAFQRMGPAVREGLDLSEHVDLERASTSLADYRGLARLLPDVSAYCLVTGDIEPVATCRRAQLSLRRQMSAMYEDSPSNLAQVHEVFLALKTAFLFYVFGLGIFMLSNHEEVEEVTGDRVRLASRALPVGAVAVLFWPILNQAYVQSMRAMFGLDQSGSFVEFSPLYVAFSVVWAAAIILFFLRLTRAEAAQWGQAGTVILTVITVLQFDLLVRQMNVFIGAGAEPASLISAIALLLFLAWQARLILRGDKRKRKEAGAT